MTAVDPSDDLLGICARSALAGQLSIELLKGRIEDLPALCGGRTFDLVCCHGVMMYLDDWEQALVALARQLTVAGSNSVTFRNGHALALRPGLRGDWNGAITAFASTVYVNELGIAARAHRIEEIEAGLASAGLRAVAWYGVRVFTDAEPVDTPPPDPTTLARLLSAEEAAGASDPYRWIASQVHVIAKVA